MKSVRRFLWLSIAVVLLSLSASSSWAVADGVFFDYSLGYFNIGPFDPEDGNPAGTRADNALRIINPGTSTTSGPTSANPDGFLCANIYVFNPNQHMLACCSCPLTKNAMLTFSVLNNLLGPTTAVRPGTSGVIKVVSSLRSTDKTCNANATYSAFPELATWLSHWVGSVSPVTLTEQELEEADLVPAELSSLQTTCGTGIDAKTVRACTCPSAP